jgi:hypothetical protein
MQGDGVCDLKCDTPTCNFDNNDCMEKDEKVIEICPVECTSELLNNQVCDEVCNVKVCAFDTGKCLDPECAPGCTKSMAIDGKC